MKLPFLLINDQIDTNGFSFSSLCCLCLSPHLVVHCRQVHRPYRCAFQMWHHWSWSSCRDMDNLGLWIERPNGPSPWDLLGDGELGAQVQLSHAPVCAFCLQPWETSESGSLSFLFHGGNKWSFTQNGELHLCCWPIQASWLFLTYATKFINEMPVEPTKMVL